MSVELYGDTEEMDKCGKTKSVSGLKQIRVLF
jgi:hypothetical protein